MKILTAITALIMILAFDNAARAFSSDIDFSGQLVVEPCTLAAGGQGDNININFGVIPDKVFYFNYPARSAYQSFRILLRDCDVSIGNQVKISFLGTEDKEQAGLMAIANGPIKHVAIGFQELNGVDLGINKQSVSYKLSAGENALEFRVFLQASKTGVQQKNIGNGQFEAIATFLLEYP